MNILSVKRLVNFLDGKKTYAVAILMFVASVGPVAGELANVLNGGESWTDFVNSPSTQLFLTSPAIGFLRAGISKV